MGENGKITMKHVSKSCVFVRKPGSAIRSFLGKIIGSVNFIFPMKLHIKFLPFCMKFPMK